MNRIVVETALGAIPIWNRGLATRPLVLVVRGMLPSATSFEWLSPKGVDVAWLHLPGVHSPILKSTSVEAFAVAFDQVIEQRFQDRKILVLGVSTGCLPALALQSPNIEAWLLVEPFFATEKLWPLIELLRPLIATDRALKEWCWRILGISETAIEDRNYRHLATKRLGPRGAVVGNIPLQPRRPVNGLPSLTDASDRALLITAGFDVWSASSGHAVDRDDPDAVSLALEKLLKEFDHQYKDAAGTASA